MKRIIVIAKSTGPHKKTGLALKRGESYQINDADLDSTVFARPGEDLGEEKPAKARTINEIKEAKEDEKTK